MNYAYTIRDKVSENELMMKQIAHNTAEQATSGDLPKAIDDAVMHGSEAHKTRESKYSLILKKQKVLPKWNLILLKE